MENRVISIKKINDFNISLEFDTQIDNYNAVFIPLRGLRFPKDVESSLSHIEEFSSGEWFEKNPDFEEYYRSNQKDLQGFVEEKFSLVDSNASLRAYIIITSSDLLDSPRSLGQGLRNALLSWRNSNYRRSKIWIPLSSFGIQEYDKVADLKFIIDALKTIVTSANEKSSGTNQVCISIPNSIEENEIELLKKVFITRLSSAFNPNITKESEEKDSNIQSPDEIKTKILSSKDRNFWWLQTGSLNVQFAGEMFSDKRKFSLYTPSGKRRVNADNMIGAEVGDLGLEYRTGKDGHLIDLFEVTESAKDSKYSKSNDNGLSYRIIFKFNNRTTRKQILLHSYLGQNQFFKNDQETLLELTYDEFKEVLNTTELAPLEEDEITESKNEYIKWFFDDPTEEDKLFRDHTARTFVKQMHSIWPYYDKEKKQRLQKSFMVHIQGPWGSGKSSFLNFIVNHLKELNIAKEDKKNKWKIVQFNAWKNQHVNEPWWVLLNTIYQQTICPKWWNIFNWKAWKERFRRLKTGNKYYLIFAIVVFILTGLGVVFGIRFLNRTNIPGGNYSINIEILLGVITAIFGLIASIFAISKNLNDSLSSASDASASNFLKNAKDPMKRIKTHFEKLIKDIDRPVAILIDDLDRCHPEFVVKFMEGIQTLFRNGNILYIVAGDRKWISSCFEIEYEKFGEKIDTPGTRLGYLFVQKAFQLSIRMPVMTNSVKERFWKYLLDVKDKQDLKAKKIEIAGEFKGLETEEAIEDQINTLLKEQKEIEPLIRAQAVQTLSDNVSLKETEHILQEYHPYLEPNPRSIKRLASYYPLATSNRILEGMDIERSILVRWIEITHRWPLLHEAIEKNPELINYYTSQPEFEKKLDKGLLQLFEDSEDLKKLIEGKRNDGKQVDPKFTVDDVMKCMGIYDKKTGE